MTQPASRLITLIMLLQRQPNQKAAVLSKTLGISIRTLHRYFTALDEMGIPVYTERGPHGGFSLVRGYKMPPLVFSPEEAASVYLGTSLVEEIWGSLYRDAANGAMAKLDNVLPREQQEAVAWARRSMIVSGMRHTIRDALAPTLELLRRAIRDLKQVRMVYLKGNNPEPQPQPREVDAYALVHRWGWWYVVGFCHLRSGMRSFRVDRIHEVSFNGNKFTVPADFNVHNFLTDEFKNEGKVDVQMRFLPQVAPVARANQSNWESMTEQDDGSIIVTFPSPDLTWAASTVLAYGPMVIAMSPPALSKMVFEWAKKIGENYETEYEESKLNPAHEVDKKYF